MSLRLVLLFVCCTFACAAPPRASEAPRALPAAAPRASLDETFRGLFGDEVSSVTVDGHLIDRASIDERSAAVNLRAHVHGPERALRVRAIDELLDEVLVRQAAERLHLSVSPDEVERAKRLQMLELGLNDALWASEVEKQGLTESGLARQRHNQLLRAKLSQAVFGPIDVGEGDERSAHVALVQRESDSFQVEVEVLAVDATDEKLAASIVTRARHGEDFCKLVATYSVDVSAKSSCGLAGPLPPRVFLSDAERSLAKMGDGDVSDAQRVSKLLVVLRLRRRLVPTFDEVRARMHDAALDERAAKLFAAWLKEQGAHARIEAR